MIATITAKKSSEIKPIIARENRYPGIVGKLSSKKPTPEINFNFIPTIVAIRLETDYPKDHSTLSVTIAAITTITYRPYLHTEIIDDRDFLFHECFNDLIKSFTV